MKVLDNQNDEGIFGTGLYGLTCLGEARISSCSPDRQGGKTRPFVTFEDLDISVFENGDV